MSPEAASGVVVAHSRLASALVGAVERISGVQGALRPLSNQGCSPEELERRVQEEIGGGRAVVFVDLASGSCAFAGRRVGLQRPGIAVITGVNLPMLLDFVFHREMELEALADRLVRKGSAGMVVAVAGGGRPGDGDAGGGRTPAEEGG